MSISLTRAASVACSLLCAIMTTILVADVKAGPKVARETHTETIAYTGPSGVNTERASVFEVVRCDAGLPGCNQVDVLPGDRFAKLVVTDASGQQVYAYTSQTPGSAYSALCTESTDPVPVAAGTPLYVWVLSGTCDDGTPSFVTQGEIEVTFFNRKP